MANIEQKFSSLESSIRTNCTSPDNAELRARLKDMVDVIAEGLRAPLVSVSSLYLTLR